MANSPVLLIALREEQRAKAQARFCIIRSALEDGISQAQVARTHNLSKSTILQWIKHYREKGLAGLADAKVCSDSHTVFYTPPVSASVSRLEKESLTVFAAFSYLVEAANQSRRGTEEFLVTRRYTPFIALLIVDEANRLKDAGLELVRDFVDRSEFGLVLLGTPGLEKPIPRASQLYSHIGFNHEMELPSQDETRDFLKSVGDIA